MIEPADAEFHRPATDDPEWAEVFSASFFEPEARINARAYLLFRPQFGVAQTSVTILDQDALTPWRAAYADFRPHVPMPASLTGFTLANGLSLQTDRPHERWRLRLESDEDVSFDVVFEAVMAPFSPFSPQQNPRAGAPPAGVGHFEQSGRVTGLLHLRGRQFEVDCHSMMNHGWGPRRDLRHHGSTRETGLTWLHAHFDDASAFYGYWTYRHDAPETLSLLYGYVLRDGHVTGLADGEARVRPDADRYPVEVEILATDAAGGAHRLRGTSLHRHLWACWPNMITFSVFAEWTWDGRAGGHGDVLQFAELGALTALEADRRWRDPRGAPR